MVLLTQEMLEKALISDVDLTEEGHRLEFRDLVIEATAFITSSHGIYTIDFNLRPKTSGPSSHIVT